MPPKHPVQFSVKIAGLKISGQTGPQGSQVNVEENSDLAEISEALAYEAVQPTTSKPSKTSPPEDSVPSSSSSSDPSSSSTLPTTAPDSSTRAKASASPPNTCPWTSLEEAVPGAGQSLFRIDYELLDKCNAAVETFELLPDSVQSLHTRLRASSGNLNPKERILSAWNLGVSDSQVLAGSRPIQVTSESKPRAGYIALSIGGEPGPWTYQQRDLFFAAVKTEAGVWIPRTVTRGITSETEGFAYLAGAGCQWKYRL